VTRETQLVLTDWLKGNLTDPLRMRHSPLVMVVILSVAGCLCWCATRCAVDR